MKLLIVGGVAGGASAAARARRLSEDAHIVVVERGPDVSFANCGMPYYVGEEIESREKLLIVTPDRLRERFRLDVRTRSSVEAIDRAAKTVRVCELSTGRVYEEPYDKLLLAPGAAPLVPAIPGTDLPGVFTLRTLNDADRIKAAVDAGGSAIILGAGFIGLELAENFVRRGVATTVIQKDTQVLSPFDPEMMTGVEEHLRQRGVDLVLGQTATAIHQLPGGLEVHLTDGRTLRSHFVILGIGVRPESRLASEAGLALGVNGGVQVNEHMQTSDPDIYAVGDAVQVEDFITHAPALIPLAGPANRQGRIAADHIMGRSEARYRGTQGTAIIRVFERVAAITGVSEKTLKRIGRAYRKVYVHPAHHAGYYPGAQAMTLKLLFDPQSGAVLGAQAVGGDGVDKRIDVLSMAIQAGMTVFDLEEAELAYAPQFGSAKDPVNMAGFVAAGLLRGEHPQLDAEAVRTGDRLLLDVRTPEEYAAGHIPGAINVPVDDLRCRLGELPRDRDIAAYCQVGQRGYLATRILRQSGYRASNVSGGYKSYVNTCRK